MFIGGVVILTITQVRGLPPGTGIALCLLFGVFMKLDRIHDELRRKR